MKLSDVYNVDLDLYARNKDYSKYSLPPLNQVFGLDLIKLVKKEWWNSEKHDFLSFSSNSDITISNGFILDTKVTPKNINSVMQCILDKGKYSLKEHDGRYIFEVVGDNSGTSWAQQSTSIGGGPVGLAVYDGKLYCACLDSNDVYVFDGSSWSKSGDVGTDPFGLAVYDGKLYCTCRDSNDVYVFDGSSWSKSSNVGNGPYGLAVYDGKLYCGCYSSDDVYVFDGSSWSKSGNVGSWPHGLAIYDGNLYCACYFSNDVYVFDGSSWSKSGDVGTYPRGLAVYDGNLYCACGGSDDVYVFDGSSWSKSGDVGNGPYGLAVYDGKLYCTCRYSNDVYVFDGSSWSKSGDVGTQPFGLTVYDGKLYCTCRDSDDVYVFGNGKWVSNTNANGYGSQDEIQAEITSTDIILDVNGTQTSISYSFSLATNSLDLYVGKSYGGSVAVGYSGGYPETFKGSIENLKITKNGSVTFRKP